MGERVAGPPGAAAAEVTVVRGARTYPLTVGITAWEVGPHPQAPDRGDTVHVSYRATQTGMLPPVSVELGVCAVDAADTVLLCTTIAVQRADTGTATGDADTWLGPATGPDLARTARVLVLPDQLRPGPHAGDPKDGDGYLPPRLPLPGDQLRTR
ncbi:hypothetical protein [Kitasatospora sp. NPDC094015]|uniref:hypothetical protein n=1 Tax=Kitasatospora sp. NPDC094015 TaxID=3155205 RepID=UPI003324EFA8